VIQIKLASITRIIGIIDRLGCLCTICDNYKSAHFATLTSAKQPLSLLLLLLPIVLLLMFSIIINIPAVRPQHCTASLWLTAAENVAYCVHCTVVSCCVFTYSSILVVVAAAAAVLTAVALY
jgi:hypothetical protein